jgi:hypothetical protein
MVAPDTSPLADNRSDDNTRISLSERVLDDKNQFVGRKKWPRICEIVDIKFLIKPNEYNDIRLNIVTMHMITLQAKLYIGQ